MINYLNAAIVVLKGSKDDTFEKAVAFYEQKRDKFQDDYKEQVQAHKKTETVRNSYSDRFSDRRFGILITNWRLSQS